MKKILASALVFTMLLGVSQAAEKDDFQFGVRMGAQFSKLKGESTKGEEIQSQYAKNLVGPAFGFIFEVPVNAYFEIRPELNFGSQGQRFKYPGDAVFSSWLGYVQVPILLRGQYGSDKVRGFVHVGPQFGFGAFNLTRLKKGSEKIEKESYSFKDQKLKPFDAGLSVGAGVEFPTAKGMELEVRYYAGLANINDYGIDGLTTKNQSLHVTLNVKF
ncbi:MAG: PorT family protein [Chitinophagales bacterium]|nr:PorT family protein [Chitinophagales bacterium]